MASISFAGLYAPSLSNKWVKRTALHERFLDMPRSKSKSRRPWVVTRKYCARSSKKYVLTLVRNDSGSDVASVQSSNTHKIIIVGAGIAGLAAAAAMHKIGVKSLVLEQSAGLRTTGAALGLWRNAWHVLNALDVSEELLSKHCPSTGAELLNQRGQVITGFKFDEPRNGVYEACTVERKLLVKTLASIVPEGTICFNSKVVSVKRESSDALLELTLADGSTLRTQLLLGADGANSVIADWLGLFKTRYVGYIGVRGMAEYNDGQPYGTTIKQYIGAGSRAGVVPISSTKVYWFFTFNQAIPGGKVVDPEDVKRDLLARLDGWPAFMNDLLNRTPVESLSRAALADRWELPGTPSPVQSRVTLAGDALHPMTPNLGQGGCCALEDAIILAQQVGPILAAGENPPLEKINEALGRYVAERRQRTLWLTIKSFVIGSFLQMAFPPAVFLRDNVMLPLLVSPKAFLSHTDYNPGQLPRT